MTIGVTVTREGIVVVVGLLLLFPTTVRGIMEYCLFLVFGLGFHFWIR